MRSSNDINPNFRSVSDQVTVKELVSVIGTSSFGYLVIEHVDSDYAVWPLRGEKAIQMVLDRAADKLGPIILKLRLGEVPGLTEPCLPVEVNDPWSWAERWTRQRQSPAQCAVVLKDGQLVGVLDTVSRGEHLTSLPGLRFALFQESEDGVYPLRHCTTCGKDFEFYGVRVIEKRVIYVCPHCHQPMET
jgi:DNA-directed RNA polymerase subunit RPC12/RpoP